MPNFPITTTRAHSLGSITYPRSEIGAFLQCDEHILRRGLLNYCTELRPSRVVLRWSRIILKQYLQKKQRVEQFTVTVLRSQFRPDVKWVSDQTISSRFQ